MMEVVREQVDGDIIISTKKELLNITVIHQYLSTQSYWAGNIPLEIVQRGIDNSLCFGVYSQGQQIGFARVITDFATFGYLADVFIVEAYRGKGLSKKLMDFIFNLKELEILRRIVLVTRDAHTLYERFNFKPLASPANYMELHRPNVYKNQAS